MADLAHLKRALAAYTGDEASLNQFAQVATEELGENWAEVIYDTLTDLTADERERLDHAFQYYAATTAWNEAQAYLTQAEPLDKAQVEERIPILEHWLAFFQESGLAVIDQLRQKLATQRESAPPAFMGAPDDTPPTESQTAPIQTPTEESAASEPVRQTSQQPTAESPTPVVQQPADPDLWPLEKIHKQITLMQDLQAWVAARCIELGNKEVFAYPHYGLVVDMMKQTRADIQAFLESGELLEKAERAHAGEVQRLQDYQLSLDKDLEIAAANGASDETDLIKDDLTAEDLKRVLGQLDTSNTPEFSGPAPDGFEPVSESEVPLDEKTITNEYRQIENVVFSEQNNKKPPENEKKTSQMPQNGVKRKLSFSLGNKKPSGN